ncbi:hypothetical protein PENTCL1PPCAC_10019, partial [Pristionchus entomophagus]
LLLLFLLLAIVIGLLAFRSIGVVCNRCSISSSCSRRRLGGSFLGCRGCSLVVICGSRSSLLLLLLALLADLLFLLVEIGEQFVEIFFLLLLLLLIFLLVLLLLVLLRFCLHRRLLLSGCLIIRLLRVRVILRFAQHLKGGHAVLRLGFGCGRFLLALAEGFLKQLILDGELRELLLRRVVVPTQINSLSSLILFRRHSSSMGATGSFLEE